MSESYLDAAIEQAQIGRSEGGIPIGSVLVVDGAIAGRGHNQRVQHGSVVLHAEMDCLEDAGRLHAAVYSRATLYSTLSPCHMCTGAILLYGIKHVVVGEDTTFKGPTELLRSYGVTVDIVDDDRCIAMMEDFILEHPKLWFEDIGEDWHADD